MSIKKKTIEEEYDEVTHHEHILALPDTYIGSISLDKIKLWIYSDEKERLIFKEIEIVPGLYKIYDEILVNARDHCVRDKTCDEIKVNINQETGEISVFNNGTGVRVEIHSKTQVYGPEMIFGRLLTSGNYKQKGKIVGGKNGYGAKLANIYSTEFIIETVDMSQKKYYYQKFTNNMYKKEDPIIKKVSKNTKSYTKIKFIPDFKKFEIKGLTNDMISLFKKRVYDIAATTPKVKVYFNDNYIDFKNFEDYIKLYYENLPSPIIYEEINERWTIGVVFDPEVGFTHTSYVNGVCTYQGGTHVEYITKQITKKVAQIVNDKNKNLKVKDSIVKENLTVFINTCIEDPSFMSQIKESLTTVSDKYGSKCEISNEFIEKLNKETNIIDYVTQTAKFKDEQRLKSTDGKKSANVFGIAKLDDAKWAGKTKSCQCTLILTEGDSAKKFALDGLSVIGYEKYGVFPLKGKSINVREKSTERILANEEFTNIKLIMGLKQGKIYENVNELRYGKILILTDQDVDGSHIKGLLMNMIHTYWPSLIKLDGFIQSMSTPLLKIYKKIDTKHENPKIFFMVSDYKKWIDEELKGDISKWEKPKYYKGLGTSTAKETKELFNSFNENIIEYIWDDERAEKLMLKAFDKDKVDERKIWVSNKNVVTLEFKNGKIPYYDFFEKDLVHFSIYDNVRSIPSICDGFKPVHRKIIYAGFKYGLTKKEAKVAQFGAYVAQHTEYHHGEASIFGAIIGMAQDFVGSNNINLLTPNGNFGSRKEAGKDSAAPRYIFTKFNVLTPYLFRKEDNCVLEYNIEEGNEIEPVTYAPIIPNILINGSTGIATGFSTNIPPFDPLDICDNILRLIAGNDIKKIAPYFYGYRGSIIRMSNTKYQIKGLYNIIDDGQENKVCITEIPIGISIESYKYFLEDHCVKYIHIKRKDKKKNKVKVKRGKPDYFVEDIDYQPDNDNPYFIVTLCEGKLQEFRKIGDFELERKLKLSTTLSLTNLHLFNPIGEVYKYDMIDDIFYDFYQYRLEMYHKRRQYIIPQFENDILILEYRIKFINDYLFKDVIKIKGKKRADVDEQLKQLQYPRLSNNHLDPEEKKNFDYCNAYIFSMTDEKFNELKIELSKKKEELEKYLKITSEDIWKDEILQFIEKYKLWTIEREKEKLKEKNSTKKGKKIKK
jgi:DNA topoisomerase-2